MKHLLASLLILFGAFVKVGATSEAELREAIIASGDPIAGLYSSSAGDGLVAVVPHDDRYRILVAEGAVPAIRPATEMGWFRPTGEKGVFVGELFTKLEGTTLTTPKKFSFKTSDGSRILIVPKRGKLKIQLWKLLPYMFRAPLTVDRHADSAPSEGLLRVWPQSPSAPPTTPRAL